MTSLPSSVSVSDLELRRGLQVADILRLRAQALDRVQHRALVGGEGLPEFGRPVDLHAQHVHDFRELEQRLDRRAEPELGASVSISVPERSW
jgi:hypothetical protein